MLLRHATQQRRIILWSGFPTTKGCLSSSSRAAEAKEQAKGSKKKVRLSKGGNNSTNGKEKVQIRPTCAPNIWSLLGRGVDKSESLPEAFDCSWKNSNDSNKEDTGPKNAREMYKDPTYPTRLLPWFHHPIYSPTPPNPTSPQELLANIIAMRNAVPVIAFIRIVRYHDSFPWLQTSHSFNTVLELTVRHSAIGTVRKLLRAMQSSGKLFDERTVELVTRLRVRLGHRTLLKLRRRWLPQSTLGAHNRPMRALVPGGRIGALFGDAIEAELAQVEQGASLAILSEFLGTPQRVSVKAYRDAYLKAFRRDMKKVRSFERLERKKRKRRLVFLPKLTLASIAARPGTPLSAYESIVRDYDALAARPTRDFAPHIPPLSTTLMSRFATKARPRQDPGTLHRISLLLVRRFLLEGKREIAIRFATAHVQELCAGHISLPSRINSRILHIVHLLLHAKYGCPSYTHGRNTLMDILPLHPDLKPTPQTLVILLQNLRTADRRSVRAYETLQWFRKRWPDIEDEAVRRTVAKFALQGKGPRGEMIAREMAQREAELGTRWRFPVARHEDLSHPRARSFASVYTRENRDKQEWIRMGLITRRGGFELATRG